MGAKQTEFAASVGVSRKTQIAYESGSTSPDVAYLAGIAGQGADVYYILSGRREGALVPGHLELKRLPGFGAPDGPTQIVLPEFLVQRKIGLTPIEHLRWAINPSSAMEPDIERHAIVLVDTSQTRLDQLIDGATYAYSLWGRRHDVRRVLDRRDHWTVIGFGKDAEYTDVYKDDAESFEIFGTVVGVL